VTTKTLRLGVLVSGRGSNLQAILDHAHRGQLDARVAVVLSDVPDAYALERARRAGAPAIAVPRKDYASKDEFNRAILEHLRAHDVDLVVLAGYLRILGDELVDAYQGRLMNIHPSLIPSFCGKGMHGLKVHQAALDSGVKVSGVTVHFVEKDVDTGPIILQRAVPVEDDDTAETLAERVLHQEHQIYAEAIQLFAEGRLKVEGRRVRVLPA
jgi:phosphoribosylglycinamide formyltransferase-1